MYIYIYIYIERERDMCIVQLFKLCDNSYQVLRAAHAGG